jgi:hypothetical protein
LKFDQVAIVLECTKSSKCSLKFVQICYVGYLIMAESHSTSVGDSQSHRSRQNLEGHHVRRHGPKSLFSERDIDPFG